MFKTFHLNPDSIQIDNQFLSRPDYVSVSQWLDFWDDSEAGLSYDDGYAQGQEEFKGKLEFSYDEGFEAAKEECSLSFRRFIDRPDVTKELRNALVQALNDL